MARQRKSQSFPLLVVMVAAVLAAVAVMVVLKQGGGGSSLRTIEELDPNLYYENANSLRGNTYRINAEIDSSLGSSPSKGRLFSVRLKQGNNASGNVILPVLVPPELGTLTIQKGQHYIMKVKIAESGLLRVEEARKP